MDLTPEEIVDLADSKPTITPMSSFQNEITDVFGVVKQYPTPTKDTGFLRTAWLSAKRSSELLSLSYRADPMLMGGADSLTAPPDFTTKNPDLYRDYPETYWPIIYDAKGPNDLQNRYDYIQKQMNEDQELANGSVWAKLLGGIVGAATSPSSYVPLYAGAKYMRTVPQFFAMAKQVAPTASVAGFANSVITQNNRVGESDYGEAAINAMEAAVFTPALLGVGKAYVRAKEAKGLWESRKAVSMMADGLTVDEVLQPNGVFKRVVRPLYPEAMNAANVDKWQAVVDSMPYEGGLFKIPGVSKLFTNKWIGAMQTRGAYSKFPFVREFFGRMAAEGPITNAEMAGTPVPISAEVILNRYQRAGLGFNEFYTSQFYEANGMSAKYGIVNASKNLARKMRGNQMVSDVQFATAFRESMSTGAPSEIPQVNRVVEEAKKILNHVRDEYSDVHGILFDTPANQLNYLFQNWEHANINSFPEKFDGIAVSQIIEQDRLIAELQARIAPYKGRGDGNTLNPIEEQILREAETNPAIASVFEDPKTLKLNDRRELAGILKERDAIEMELKEARKLKDEVRIKELEEELNSVKADLEDRARRGEIPRRYFERKDGKIVFKDPIAALKFRKTYNGNMDEINAAARGIRERITNMSSEELIDYITGGMMRGEGVASTMERTILLDQVPFAEAGFINNDIASGMQSYLKQMGRKIAVRKAFKDSGRYGETMEDVIENMKEDYDRMYNDLVLQPESAQRTAALQRLKKDFDGDMELVKTAHDVFMGRTRRSEVYGNFGRFMRNWVYSTKLGTLPVSQITDLGAIAFKAGLLPLLVDGLKPLVKTMNGKLQGPESAAYRQYARDLNFGLNHVMGSLEAHWHSPHERAIYGTTGKGFVGVGMQGAADKMEAAANVANITSGAASVENLMQYIAASTFQGKLMRAIHQFAEGRLSQEELRTWARYGFNFNQHAAEALLSYKAVGGYGRQGSYQSLFYAWPDNMAKAAFSEAIERAVQDTVIKGGMFTGPQWLADPVLSSIFMFLRWPFAATVKYTMPLLQNPDRQKLMGFMAMVLIGSTQNPLKRMANGKAPFEDDDSLAKIMFQGVNQSGVLGILPEVMENVNLALGGNLLGDLQSEKFYARSKLGMFGPAGGIIDSMGRLVEMMMTGKINKTDLKNGLHLIPLSGNMPIRQFINIGVDALDLPEKRRDATNWMGE